MYPLNLTIKTRSFALACAFALVGCGGDDRTNAESGELATISQMEARAPDVTLAFTGAEDAAVIGTMSKGNLKGEQHEFEVLEGPAHGNVSIVNKYSGEFVYTPDPNYFGGDSFTYRVVKTARRPLRGLVTVNLRNINDAPELAMIGDMANSAETHDTDLPLPVTDIDTDALKVTVTSDDPAIAGVSSDDANRSITIIPGENGSTRIRVSVSDGQYSSQQEFEFSVGEVTKQRAMVTNSGGGDAVFLNNHADIPVTFTLEHNGFPQFQSTEQMVEFVKDMPELIVNEPFERKLWRFVRDNVYHNLPVRPEKHLNNPWSLINSVGWGICSNVAAVYVTLARKAGYEARAWGLTGHVVPEIRVNGEWQVYDPDLAIYYHTPSGKIAGVSELQADASLISAPVDAIFAGTAYDFPYSAEVAQIYGSPSDNYVGDDQFIPETENQFQKLVLPPGATLKYPGRWTPSVTGEDDAGSRLIDLYLQAKLTTPMAYTGNVVMPWMLWEVRGEGRIRIGEREFDVGSPELIEYVRATEEQLTTIEVLQADSPLEFIFFINALRYQLQALNDVRITGREVWAIDMSVIQLKEESRTGIHDVAKYLKPAL